MPNSIGKSNKAVRRFLRENMVPPTVANVERIGREIRRTESENAYVERIHKEREKAQGIPSLVDAKGDVHKRAREIALREIARRQGR
jgi:hypothetical protein